MDYCGFGIFAIWRHERPEYAWYRGKVGNESGWYADYIADVVTEVKFKRLVYAPSEMVQHFKNCGSCETAHGNYCSTCAIIRSF